MKQLEKIRIWLAILTPLLALAISGGAASSVRGGNDKIAQEYKKGKDAALKEMIGVAVRDEKTVVLRWEKGSKQITAEYNIELQKEEPNTKIAGSAQIVKLREAEKKNGIKGLFEKFTGDGYENGDFAPIGDRMHIAVGEEKVYNKCYTWAYKHVKDFVGITTVFQDQARVKEKRDRALSLRVRFFTGESPGSKNDLSSKVLSEYPEFAADSLNGVVFSSDSLFAGAVILGANPGGAFRLELEPRFSSESDSSEAAGARAVDRTNGDEREQVRFPSARFFAASNSGSSESGFRQVDWAVVFANSEEEIKRNLTAALETYKGTVNEKGKRTKWVVPPLKTSIINLETRLLAVWKDNRKNRAAAMKIPFDFIGSGIKWIKVDGSRVPDYKKLGTDIIVPLEERSLNRPDSVFIEGEFINGILFAGKTALAAGKEDSSGKIPDDGRLPRSLMNLYPNPFVEKVNITLSIPRKDETDLFNSAEILKGDGIVRIYDVKGMLVKKVLERKINSPGRYSAFWDGRDRRGEQAAPGVYYCNLQIDGMTLTKRIVLLR
ncbi:MAG: hypothetical protein U5O15_07450 [Candidatus Krumholzibacteriota bacterium]|nr:hypothetical protein [Candidatus Krumholzibacteriota bacterium]